MRTGSRAGARARAPAASGVRHEAAPTWTRDRTAPRIRLTDPAPAPRSGTGRSTPGRSVHGLRRRAPRPDAPAPLPGSWVMQVPQYPCSQQVSTSMPFSRSTSTMLLSAGTAKTSPVSASRMRNSHSSAARRRPALDLRMQEPAPDPSARRSRRCVHRAPAVMWLDTALLRAPAGNAEYRFSPARATPGNGSGSANGTSGRDSRMAVPVPFACPRPSPARGRRPCPGGVKQADRTTDRTKVAGRPAPALSFP